LDYFTTLNLLIISLFSATTAQIDPTPSPHSWGF